MKGINFTKSTINTKGNVTDNTFNIADSHISATKVGDFHIPIFQNERGRYVNKIWEVTSEPFEANETVYGKDGQLFDKAVKFRTVLTSDEPIYLNKNEVHPSLTFGNTRIVSSDRTKGKRKAYKAFRRILAKMYGL